MAHLEIVFVLNSGVEHTVNLGVKDGVEFSEDELEGLSRSMAGVSGTAASYVSGLDPLTNRTVCVDTSQVALVSIVYVS